MQSDHLVPSQAFTSTPALELKERSHCLVFPLVTVPRGGRAATPTEKGREIPKGLCSLDVGHKGLRIGLRPWLHEDGPGEIRWEGNPQPETIFHLSTCPWVWNSRRHRHIRCQDLNSSKHPPNQSQIGQHYLLLINALLLVRAGFSFTSFFLFTNKLKWSQTWSQFLVHTVLGWAPFTVACPGSWDGQTTTDYRKITDSVSFYGTEQSLCFRAIHHLSPVGVLLCNTESTFLGPQWLSGQRESGMGGKWVVASEWVLFGKHQEGKGAKV